MTTLLRPPVTQSVLELFAARGHLRYGGEQVTQLEHALQAAYCAELQGAQPPLIVAALLHDVGHLLHDLDESAPEAGVDDRHELLAASWLAERFGPEIAAPVAMHVDAKRYLAAVDPGYHGVLSDPARRSLRMQGGPMNAAEIERFESQPFFTAAIRVRYWDDMAKDPRAVTPDLEHFARYLDLVTEAS